MRNAADFEDDQGRNVICDFVCPTQKLREDFGPDITIWMNTIEEGRFEDTNKMFETPLINNVNYHVEKWFDNTDEALADAIARHIRINDV